jgi:CheY-like chemotaxis protein
MTILRVLTVDDSRTILAMLHHTLSNAGFEVLEAEDGKQGLHADAVHAGFGNRSLLENDVLRHAVSVRPARDVVMEGIARPGFVKNLNPQGFVESVYFVAGQFTAHRSLLKMDVGTG